MTPQPQAHPTLGTPIMKGTWAPTTQAFSLAPPLEPLQSQSPGSSPTSSVSPFVHQHPLVPSKAQLPPASLPVLPASLSSALQSRGGRVRSTCRGPDALSHTKLTAVQGCGRCGWGGSRGRALLGRPWGHERGGKGPPPHQRPPAPPEPQEHPRKTALPAVPPHELLRCSQGQAVV